MWDNCPGYWWGDTSILHYYPKGTPDIYNDSITYIAEAWDSNQYVGLVSSFNTKKYQKSTGEIISSVFNCGFLISGYRYRFSFYTHSGQPYHQSCIRVSVGYESCDTSHVIYHSFIDSAKWVRHDVVFESPVNAIYFSINNDLCADSLDSVFLSQFLIYVSGFYLDALSPLVSDTVYNSEHRPIIVEREPCIGDTVVLRSPVDYPGHEAVWLRDGAEVGRGLELRDTLSQPAEYYLLLGEDSCQSLVLRRTIKPRPCREDGLVVFPSAFTPDGDGHNDGYGPAYVAPSVDAGSYRLDIYDRYGSRVYHSIDPHARWMARGYSMGMYIYHVRYEDVYGHPYTQHGELTLLR